MNREAILEAMRKTPDPPDETHMDRPRYVRAVVEQNRLLAGALNELRVQHEELMAKHLRLIEMLGVEGHGPDL